MGEKKLLTGPTVEAGVSVDDPDEDKRLTEWAIRDRDCSNDTNKFTT